MATSQETDMDQEDGRLSLQQEHSQIVLSQLASYKHLLDRRKHDFCPKMVNKFDKKG